MKTSWLHTGKTLVVRTAIDSVALVRPIPLTAVARIDKDQTATESETYYGGSRQFPVRSERAISVVSLFGVFGGLAILLALIGIYGVVAWVVGQRTLEVGIRVAIGARPSQVARMLLIQSLWPVLLGVAIGAVGGIRLQAGC